MIRISTTSVFISWQPRDLGKFCEAVDLFVEKLRVNLAFKSALITHPWLRFPNTHAEEILDNPQCPSSIVVFLHAVGDEVSPDALHILALPHKRIPALNLEWLEILLSHCLYSDALHSPESDAVFKSLRHELLQMGAIEHRKVKLRSPAEHMKLLTTSVTKLTSIKEIVRLESGVLGSDLRCVVLTDFIRKADLPQKNNSETPAFEDRYNSFTHELRRGASCCFARMHSLAGAFQERSERLSCWK